MPAYINLFPASWLSRGMFFLTTTSIFGSYFIAFYNHDVPLLPSITATGIHYPEYILFRIGNLIVTPILALVYLLQYLWLNQQRSRLAKRRGESADLINIPRSIIYIGVIAALSFSLCIATISDGYMNINIHIYVATLTYFLATYINFFIITYTTYRLRQIDKSIFPQNSYNIKLAVLSGFLATLVLLEILTSFLKVSLPVWFQNLIEWYLVLLLGAFLYSFSYDFADFKLVVEDTGEDPVAYRGTEEPLIHFRTKQRNIK